MPELKSISRDHGLRNYSRMRKAELELFFAEKLNQELLILIEHLLLFFVCTQINAQVVFILRIFTINYLEQVKNDYELLVIFGV